MVKLTHPLLLAIEDYFDESVRANSCAFRVQSHLIRCSDLRGFVGLPHLYPPSPNLAS